MASPKPLETLPSLPVGSIDFADLEKAARSGSLDVVNKLYADAAQQSDIAAPAAEAPAEAAPEKEF